MLMKKPQLEKAMRRAAGNQHNSLIDHLQRSGIHPPSFAHFLSQYIKKKPVKTKSVISDLLDQTLRAQAEVIIYHLNH